MKSISSPANLRTILAALFIAATVHFTQSRDLLVDFTRPVVMTTLRWIGIAALDRGEVMAVGRLHVPWTRDCAGINLLLVLIALAVWVNRHEPRARVFWLRVAAMVPAALVANVLRVLTLIAYRQLAYPGVESPQTHYFIGFIWLAPFVALITPRDERPLSARLMETLHAAAVIALLAPMSGTPNATLVSLAAVFSLAGSRTQLDLTRGRRWLTFGWMAAGLAIALVSVESFWLPWLLLCPLLGNLTPDRLLIASCTHTLVAMQPWSWGLALLGLALQRRNATATSSDPAKDHTPPVFTSRQIRHAALAFFACLPMPFLASTLLSLGQQSWQPPATVESRPMPPNGFEIRLPSQPHDIGLACYTAATRDRHHTVRVCLKYRGIEVEPVPGCPAVFTEGKHWFREFFLQDGHLITDYAGYVKSTFRPWSAPGVHLIFVCLRDKQPPADFSATSERLARQFHTHCHPAPTTDLASRDPR